MDRSWPMKIQTRLYQGQYGDTKREILVHVSAIIECEGSVNFTSNFKSRVIIGTTNFKVKSPNKTVSIGLVPLKPLKESHIEVKFSYENIPDKYFVQKIPIPSVIAEHLPETPDIVLKQYYTFVAYRRLKIVEANLGHSFTLYMMKKAIREDMYTWSVEQSNGAKDLILDILTRLDNRQDVKKELTKKINLIRDQEIILEPYNRYEVWME